MSLFRICLALVGFGAFACTDTFAAGSPTGDPLLARDPLRSPLRYVRVLLITKGKRVRFRSSGPVRVTDVGGDERSFENGEVSVEAVANGKNGLSVNGRRWDVTTITIHPASPTGLVLERRPSGVATQPDRYPGLMNITLDSQGHLRVVNLVDLEEYVSCVVGREVWPTFEPEAFKVQAIAARTFVLHEMLARQERDYDLTGTQGSQVYHGYRDDATGQRAIDAARQTFGIALTWFDGRQDQIFCSYYSSACGGMSQSAEIFGEKSDIAPLKGQIACDYCRIAPKSSYRWGPQTLSKVDVFKRLASRYPNYSELRIIQAIEVTEKTPTGRPTMLRVVGTNGKAEDILAERFRLAIGPSVMRSTDCRIRVVGSDVVFDKGRGFGHGLGLCQWGAQGQALKGKQAADILRYYFPGARVTRVY
jgi:stage II sporulation protein D